MTLGSHLLSHNGHTSVPCGFPVVNGLRRVVTENPKTLGLPSLSFRKLGTRGAVWDLLLPRCHQMELTSGCYTVLCHCAYAQNSLTATLQAWTGSETGVPPAPIKHGTNRLPSLALATKNAEGHKGVF